VCKPEASLLVQNIPGEDPFSESVDNERILTGSSDVKDEDGLPTK